MFTPIYFDMGMYFLIFEQKKNKKKKKKKKQNFIKRYKIYGKK